MTQIRFTTFPRTKAPSQFARSVVDAFISNESAISTIQLEKGLTSNEVLSQLRPNLLELGFEIELGKTRAGKIERPVFYGENGKASITYQIDAYHSERNYGLEVEAGRGWMGNAIYRDLIQALVMVNVEHLILAVANTYKYQTGGKQVVSADYVNTVAVADALFGHSRIRMPYDLTVIGY